MTAGPDDGGAPLSPTRRGPPPDSPSAAAQQHRQPASPGHARGGGGGRGPPAGSRGRGGGAGPGRPAALRTAAPNGVIPEQQAAPAGPPKVSRLLAQHAVSVHMYSSLPVIPHACRIAHPPAAASIP